MRRIFPFLALSTALVAIGGCAQAPHRAGVLRLTQEADPPTLDPARSYDTNSIPFTRLIYRGLIDYDVNAKIYPEMAEKYTISPDGKTYTFIIRKEAKFNDGTPVTADDFRFALERVIDPKTASDGSSFYNNIIGAVEWAAYCSKLKETDPREGHIKGIECPDAHTLIFHLKKPEATFINNLSLPFAYAVPRAYTLKLEKEGKKLAEHPNGDGPYKMVEWVHDGWLTLEKNPGYYRHDLPKANRIEASFGISTQLATMLYEQGNLDLLQISAASPPDFLRLDGEGSPWRSQVVHAPMMDIRYMAMNNELAPFTDKRVRQAFNYAVNRNRIAGLLSGRVQLAHGVLPPGMPSYDPKLKGYSYDPAKAKALLKAANFKDGTYGDLTLLYPTDEMWYGKAAQSIQADLKAVGVTISIQALRYSDLKAKAGTRGKNGSRLALLGWIQDYPDPSNFFDPLFNTRSISAVSSVNRSFYSNPKVDAILDAALGETNQPKRLAMYNVAEKQIVDDAPVVFLHHSERYVIRQPWVKGPVLHPMWSAVYEPLAVN